MLVQLNKINQQLKQAIASKDKRSLLSVYDEIQKSEIDIYGEDVQTLEEYDNLIEQANDLLYS